MLPVGADELGLVRHRSIVPDGRSSRRKLASSPPRTVGWWTSAALAAANISSIYGNAGTAGSGVYSATKAAVRVLSDSLRVEAQGKIKVTVVRPTGVMGTGLGGGIVNPQAIVGLTGQHTERFGERVQRLGSGGLRPEETAVDDVRYWAITPDDLVRQIVYAIDQPWGVTIGDITVRATGEDYIL